MQNGGTLRGFSLNGLLAVERLGVAPRARVHVAFKGGASIAFADFGVKRILHRGDG